jgi:hypothetical protein
MRNILSSPGNLKGLLFSSVSSAKRSSDVPLEVIGGKLIVAFRDI